MSLTYMCYCNVFYFGLPIFWQYKGPNFKLKQQWVYHQQLLSLNMRPNPDWFQLFGRYKFFIINTWHYDQMFMTDHTIQYHTILQICLPVSINVYLTASYEVRPAEKGVLIFNMINTV